ncbi:ABC transporter permease [bacterium]|nr:ABC transporter permease [bacterium]
MGFDKEHVAVIANADLLGDQTQSFKTALMLYPEIQEVSGSYTLPGRYFNNWGVIPEGQDHTTLDFGVCDANFANTLKLEMAEGRFFSEEFSTDLEAIILNEEAVRQLGWEDPLGKTLEMNRKKLTVIGVVKDFHYQSLHQGNRYS